MLFFIFISFHFVFYQGVHVIIRINIIPGIFWKFLLHPEPLWAALKKEQQIFYLFYFCFCIYLICPFKEKLEV